MATISLSDDYRWLSLWTGRLEVRTTADAGAETFEVPPHGEAKFTEHGVALAWPGDEPSGVFVPWGSVAVIRQVPDAAALHAA